MVDMVNIVCSIAFVIDFVIIFRLARRKRWRRRRLVVILLVSWIVLGSICSLPFVNIIWPETDPEVAFMRTGKGELLDMVYGEHSCLAEYKVDGSTISEMVLVERNGCYYECPFLPIKEFRMGIDGGHSLSYTAIKGWVSPDVYVTGSMSSFVPDEEKVTITDNMGTTFNVYAEPFGDTEYTYYSFAAYIADMPDNYAITIVTD